MRPEVGIDRSVTARGWARHGPVRSTRGMAHRGRHPGRRRGAVVPSAAPTAGASSHRGAIGTTGPVGPRSGRP